MTVLAAIPSPTQGVWELGPLPLRAYALCIVAGIVAAVLITEKRWVARGGAPGDVLDIAVWAVPFGIVGHRVYHVLTRHRSILRPATASRSRRYKIGRAASASGAPSPVARSVPGSAAVSWASRCGSSLMCSPPACRLRRRSGGWQPVQQRAARRADPRCRGCMEVHRMDPNNPRDARCSTRTAPPSLLPGLYHPTFLYEALWCVGVAVLVPWMVDRRLKLGHGRAFALYVMGYTAGRFWIELMRTDPSNENLLGQRLNVWTSIVVGLAGRRLPRAGSAAGRARCIDRRPRRPDDGQPPPGRRRPDASRMIDRAAGAAD